MVSSPPGTTPTLLQLDGNLGRNAGITPWTVFNDLRVAKRINFSERFSTDFIADMFNIANKVNVSAVSPLFSNRGQPTADYDHAAIPVRDEAELVDAWYADFVWIPCDTESSFLARQGSDRGSVAAGQSRRMACRIRSADCVIERV